MKTVKDYIRTIPDFPHEGIMFRDVTTLFADPRGLRLAIDQLLDPFSGVEVDKIIGLEARGFILGGAIAYQLGKGFVPIRKQGKLPGKTLSQAYTLEYGEAVMEIHEDAIEAGEKVLVVDDLLATGGTAAAGLKLLERLGADVIGCAFVIDLPDLGGRRVLGSGHAGPLPLLLRGRLARLCFSASVKADRGIKHMGAPAPRDLQITLRHAFIFKATALQQTA